VFAIGNAALMLGAVYGTGENFTLPATIAGLIRPKKVTPWLPPSISVSK
jgi:hypothetical protein